MEIIKTELWRGASPKKVMSHNAIQEKKDDEAVDWMEKLPTNNIKSNNLISE